MARVVVITGGGTGIGAACARLMCAAGDRVLPSCRTAYNQQCQEKEY